MRFNEAKGILTIRAQISAHVRMTPSAPAECRSPSRTSSAKTGSFGVGASELARRADGVGAVLTNLHSTVAECAAAQSPGDAEQPKVVTNGRGMDRGWLGV